MRAYRLGIDVGTTFTAAAVARGDRAEIVDLGVRRSATASVVYLGADGSVVVGDRAQRRGDAEPDRAVREFKRRFGDPVPIMLGGTPIAADVLTARVLTWVLESVTEREGGPPDGVTVTHPANWGPYKRDLLGQAVRLAGVDGALLLSEPEAAARSYLVAGRIAEGRALAVYDLGGGTFDAAVLTRTGNGFALLGRPEGIDHLGGVDLDEAVVEHVRRAVPELAGLDPTDAAVAAGLGRLRAECVAAKEALSEDTDTVIPVAVGGIATDVRLTRTEFEELIGPALTPTLDVLSRVIGSADPELADLATVLLVGGSSRIPLVSMLVGQRTGLPVAVDAHPKNAVAIGAALTATAVAPPVSVEPPEPVGSARAAEAVVHPVPWRPADPGPPAATAAQAGPVPERPSPVPASGPAGPTDGPGRRVRRRRRGLRLAASAALAALGLAGAGLVVAGLWPGLATGADPAVVVREPAADPGEDPFSDDYAEGGTALPDPAPSPVTGSYPGDTPGLYGGSGDSRLCDRAGLAVFLAREPQRVAAWAAVLGVDADGVEGYLATLTPVLLRADTRVTNHGYRDGRATPRQAVLQAGTAVLVDRFGVPRVKCGCGNPLLEPSVADGAERYAGSSWPGFRPESAMVIRSAARPVAEFQLIDLVDGSTVLRPPGTEGERDVAAPVPLPTTLPSAAAPGSAERGAGAGSGSPASGIPVDRSTVPPPAPPAPPAGGGPAPASVPAAPTGLTATATAADRIVLRWNDNAQNETGFEVNNCCESRTASANATSFTWTGLEPGAYMCFRVRAVNAVGGSSWESPRIPIDTCATTPGGGPPRAPSGLSVAAEGPDRIVLRWTDNSAAETAFEINNGDESRTTGGNAASYAWGGLAPGTYMCFRVRAVNSFGASDWVPSSSPYYVCTTTPG